MKLKERGRNGHSLTVFGDLSPGNIVGRRPKPMVFCENSFEVLQILKNISLTQSAAPPVPPGPGKAIKGAGIYVEMLHVGPSTMESRGIGGVVRNESASWVLRFMQSFHHASNNLMELMALRQGLQLVMEHNLCPVEICVDSEEGHPLERFDHSRGLYPWHGIDTLLAGVTSWTPLDQIQGMFRSTRPRAPLAAQFQSAAVDLVAALTDKYWPVFTVHQGMFTIAVVSSYEAIKECFTIQDKNLANRVATCSCKYLGYDHANLTFAYYGPYWRMVRKLVVNNLLSAKSLERLKLIRISEVESSIKELYTLFVANKAKNEPTKVYIGHCFDDMMLNITVKMIGGKRYSQVNNKAEEKEEVERFRKAFNETMYYLALVGIEDAFPIPLLQWLDLQGNIKVMKRIADEMDVILQC
ncbi:putative isovaleryl-CoA dehydrogenase 1, mitochondrial-like [Capsicum annuum]|nr:putative isovaleryl-CoA dehydrogenase 1, mitochondrial-like [Capsicum annuum]